MSSLKVIAFFYTGTNQPENTTENEIPFRLSIKNSSTIFN
jgi:hypothetical protein